MFKTLAFILLAVIIVSTGFNPEWNWIILTLAIILLTVGAIADSLWRRWRRRPG